MSLTRHFPLAESPETPPVAVALDVDDTSAVFTFDKDLEEQTLNAANWVLNLDPSGTQEAVNAEIVGGAPNQVGLEFGVSIAGLSIEYLAFDPDVVGTNGLDVAAFDWPL